MKKAIIRPSSYFVDCPHCGEAVVRGDLGFAWRQTEIRFEEDELSNIKGTEFNCNECNKLFKIKFDLPTE